MRRSQGTGEYGVLVNNIGDYHEEVTLEFAKIVVQAIAQKHNIPCPEVKLRRKAKKRWGTYHYEGNLIALYPPISFGVVIHETCHAVVRHKVPGAKSHGAVFKGILAQEFRHYGL